MAKGALCINTDSVEASGGELLVRGGVWLQGSSPGQGFTHKASGLELVLLLK